MLKESYKLTCKQVLKHFGTDAVNGLNNEQVAIQKEKFGLNGKFEIIREGVLITFYFQNCPRMKGLHSGN